MCTGKGGLEKLLMRWSDFLDGWWVGVLDGEARVEKRFLTPRTPFGMTRLFRGVT